MRIRRSFIILVVFVLFIFGLNTLPLNAESNQLVINVPNTFFPQNESAWRKIEYTLTHTHYKTYIFNWRGFGGNIYQGRELIQAINEAHSQNKVIIMRIIGNSYSMHAVVPCYADQVIYASSGFLMFHADSYTDENGKEHRVSRSESIMNDGFQVCVNKNIITNHDVDVLWQGYEVYVYKSNHWYKPDERNLNYWLQAIDN